MRRPLFELARNGVQELRELGLRGSAFRVAWELKTRSGLQGRFSRAPDPAQTGSLRKLAYARPADVRNAVSLPARSIDRLVETAERAAQGRILAFGRWEAEYGAPPDWHVNPVNGKRWDPEAYWSRALTTPGVGDIKLTWEIGRFPQGYWMARGATFRPDLARSFTERLAEHIDGFLRDNPWPLGVHWHSGQEIAFRLMAWLFADATLELPDRTRRALADALRLGAFHVEQHIDYARLAVYNNHVLSEALLLYAAGTLLPAAPESPRWRAFGERVLTEQAKRQFYPDGGYIQQSHTYERVALQVLGWACLVARTEGASPPLAWTAAMGRGVDFLYAHQNEADGRLPNYGANDGALPALLSTCDYADFRPTLQAASIVARRRRLYAAGPWDEEAAWLVGEEATRAPLAPPRRTSRSFPTSGHHVLRADEPGTFASFRSGSLLDRFSQIDMLALDVFWRGHNVLTDPGSYLYNADPKWHAHFFRTASHNTVTVDGHDQMLHHRQFKTLYPANATTLSFDAAREWTAVTGEHDGFARHPGRIIHRRSVAQVGNDVWVVVDTLRGEPEQEHEARLQWQGGPFPWRAEPNGLCLETPAGDFHVRVFDNDALPVPTDVVAGGEHPPRGWVSRYYGEKVPAPSLVASTRSRLPLTFLSVLCAPDLVLRRDEFGYVVGEHRFHVRDGCVRPSVEP